mgnify:CR=1 FL=1
MRFSAQSSFAALGLIAVLSLTGCSSSSDTASTPTPTVSSQSDATITPTDAPATAPTTKATSDPNMQVSLLDEKAYTAALKPLGFACDQSVIKAISLAGTQVEFSTVVCRRGQEPDVVLTLAASQNELELITTASCQSATGTVLRTPIVAGGNWQLLSAANNRPLLEELGKILHGKTMSIKELCG